MSKLVLLALLGMVAVAAAVDAETQKKVKKIFLLVNGPTGIASWHSSRDMSTTGLLGRQHDDAPDPHVAFQTSEALISDVLVQPLEC